MRPHGLLAGLLAVLAASCTSGTQDGAISEVPTPTSSPVIIVGPEFGIEAASLTSALDQFADETGIDVEYRGRRFATSEVDLAVESGNPPDIAILAQPGRVTQFAQSGFAAPLPEDIAETATTSYPASLLELASFDNQVYAIPIKIDIKNLVWYAPAAFDQAGLQPPTNIDELSALADEVRSQGNAPWCVGMESGDATGWVFTDWVEQATLSLHGPDVYQDWAQGRLQFASPEIESAFTFVTDVWFTNGNVADGRGAIAATPYTTSGLGLIDGECYLHRQLGNYSLYFRDEGLEVGDKGDIDAFVFPVEHCAATDVIIGSGNFALAFDDRDDVLQTMRYLASVDFANARISASEGGYLSPHLNQDLDLYEFEIDAELAAEAIEASLFLFDASDLMPGPVGAGEFWRVGVDIVNGELAIPEALENLDRARDAFPVVGPQSQRSESNVAPATEETCNRG